MIGGTRQTSMGQSYQKNPLYEFAKEFVGTADSILTETGLDIFEEPSKVMRRRSSKEAMRKFFVENSYDTDPKAMSPDEIDDHISNMNELFENCVEAMHEHAAMGDYNPVIGIAFPIYKNILMNMVYDKGAIQKVVAVQPKFTMSMETRILVAPDGTEIDMFKEQNLMTGAIEASNPVHVIELTLPELQTTDVLSLCGGTALDDIGIQTYISGIMIQNVYIAEGDIKPNEEGYILPGGEKATAAEAGMKDVWFKTKIEFKPGYNQYERSVSKPINIKYKSAADGTITELHDSLSATMDRNKFNVYTAAGKIAKVRLSARLDTANAMLDTCSVKWKVDTTLIEIPNAIPINTTISPEEVKDLSALYQVNQLTKVMSLFKTAMANYKDDKIKEYLDDSYDIMPATNKFFNKFDYAPRQGYALDPVEWRRKMFFDFFGSEITKLFQVLNDPNMTVTVFGDPDMVRKVTPEDYTYTTPNSIGAVELDFTRTVVTTDKRVYQFIGSDKMRGSDTFVVILNPRNTDRVIYRIYDYQMYVSNEIRNINNPALPAIHAFERWLMMDYQPVQGRIQILNKSGMRAGDTDAA